jgi:hypothetical protein
LKELLNAFFATQALIFLHSKFVVQQTLFTIKAAKALFRSMPMDLFPNHAAITGSNHLSACIAYLPKEDFNL